MAEFIWVDNECADVRCDCGEQVSINITEWIECECGKKYKLKQSNELLERD